jgi:hypothetical protein
MLLRLPLHKVLCNFHMYKMPFLSFRSPDTKFLNAKKPKSFNPLVICLVLLGKAFQLPFENQRLTTHQQRLIGKN